MITQIAEREGVNFLQEQLGKSIKGLDKFKNLDDDLKKSLDKFDKYNPFNR